jgi:hypothetical protein
MENKKESRDLVDGKPQNIVIQNLPALLNVAPYMGISQNQTPKTHPTVNNADSKVKRISRAIRNYTNSIQTGSLLQKKQIHLENQPQIRKEIIQ